MWNLINININKIVLIKLFNINKVVQTRSFPRFHYETFQTALNFFAYVTTKT